MWSQWGTLPMMAASVPMPPSTTPSTSVMPLQPAAPPQPTAPPLPTAPPPPPPEAAAPPTSAAPAGSFIGPVMPQEPAAPSTLANVSGQSNPYAHYTAAQYAAMTPEQQFALQQHWQQWQAYQQEYAKWHAQYGEQYKREMAAAAAVTGVSGATSYPGYYPQQPQQPSHVQPPANTTQQFQQTQQPQQQFQQPPPIPTGTQSDFSQKKNSAEVKISGQPQIYNQPPPPIPQGTTSYQTNIQQSTNPSQSFNFNQPPPNFNRPSNPKSEENSNVTQPSNFLQQPPPGFGTGTYQGNNSNFSRSQINTQENRNTLDTSQGLNSLSEENKINSLGGFNEDVDERRSFSRFENKQRDFHGNEGGRESGWPEQRSDESRFPSNRNSWNEGNTNNSWNKDRFNDEDKGFRNNESFSSKNDDNFNRGWNNNSASNSFNRNKDRNIFSNNDERNNFNANDRAGNDQNFGNRRGPGGFNDNRPYDGNQRNPMNAGNVNQSHPGEMTDESFDKIFSQWEEQFENWKKQNANHPDREMYHRYLREFEKQRERIAERREQLRRKKLGLTNTLPQNPVASKPIENDYSRKTMPVTAKIHSVQAIDSFNSEDPKTLEDIDERKRGLREPLNESLDTTSPISQTTSRKSNLGKRKSRFDPIRESQNSDKPTEVISLCDSDEDITNIEDSEKQTTMGGIFNKVQGIPGLDLVIGDGESPKDDDEEKDQIFESQAEEMDEKTEKDGPSRPNKMPNNSDEFTGPINNSKIPSLFDLVVEKPNLSPCGKTNLDETSLSSGAITEPGDPKLLDVIPNLTDSLKDPKLLQNVTQALAQIQTIKPNMNPTIIGSSNVANLLPGNEAMQKSNNELNRFNRSNEPNDNARANNSNLSPWANQNMNINIQNNRQGMLGSMTGSMDSQNNFSFADNIQRNPNFFGNNFGGGFNRGFDGNDRNFGGGNESNFQGGNGRNFGNNDRNFGNNDRNFGNIDRNFGNNDRNFGNNVRNFGNNDRNLGTNDRNFGNNNFGGNNRNFGNMDRAFGGNNRNFRGNRDPDGNGDNDRNFGRNDRNFRGNNRNFGGNQRNRRNSKSKSKDRSLSRDRKFGPKDRDSNNKSEENSSQKNDSINASSVDGRNEKGPITNPFASKPSETKSAVPTVSKSNDTADNNAETKQPNSNNPFRRSGGQLPTINDDVDPPMQRPFQNNQKNRNNFKNRGFKQRKR